MTGAPQQGQVYEHPQQYGQHHEHPQGGHSPQFIGQQHSQGESHMQGYSQHHGYTHGDRQVPQHFHQDHPHVVAHGQQHFQHNQPQPASQVQHHVHHHHPYAVGQVPQHANQNQSYAVGQIPQHVDHNQLQEVRHVQQHVHHNNSHGKIPQHVHHNNHHGKIPQHVHHSQPHAVEEVPQHVEHNQHHTVEQEKQHEQDHETSKPTELSRPKTSQHKAVDRRYVVEEPSQRTTRVQKMSDTLRDIVQTFDEAEADLLRGCENAALAGGGRKRKSSRDRNDASDFDLSRVSEELLYLKSQGELCDVEQDVLVSFVMLLDKAMVRYGHNHMWKEEQDFAIHILSIITTEKLSQKVISGEALDNIVGMCKTQLQQIILPQVDDTYLSKSSHHKTHKKEKNTKKKRKRRRSSKTEQDGGNHSSASDHEEKPANEKPVSIGSLMPGMCKILLLLDQLISIIHKLEDELLLQVVSVCISTLYVDSTKSKKKDRLADKTLQLQQVSIDLLRALYRENESHRGFIMEEFVDCLNKLPSRSQKLVRTYKIAALDDASASNSSQNIMVATSALLEFVQSVCINPEGPRKVSDLKYAVSTGKEFLTKLLDKCASPAEHADDEDTKQLRLFLSHFVEDLLTVLHAPEWPASELVLKLVSSFLSNMLLKQNQNSGGKNGTLSLTQQRFSIQALSLLGDILARVQMDIVWSSENKLTLPYKKISVDKETCPICQVGTRGKTLQCMECGCNFHCSCVEVSQTSKSFCCDDCLMLSQLDTTSNPPAEETSSLESFRKLHLNYLAMAAAEGSVSAGYAYDFCLSQWFQSDSKRGCSVEHLDAIQKQWRERKQVFADFKAKATGRGRRSISRFTAFAIAKHLAATNPMGLCTEETNKAMLSRLLGILGTGQASFRARAIKSLSKVLEQNVLLMQDPKVKSAVELRVLDESISVREAALDLVGSYVQSKPELVDVYLTTLLQRLSDLGLSVRKRVVKILRGLLVAHRELPVRTQIHTALVERLLDSQEEDTIKDMIRDLFRFLWFSESRSTLTSMNSASLDVDDDEARAISSMTPLKRKRSDSAVRTPMQAVRSANKRRKSLSKPSASKSSLDSNADQKINMERNAADIMELVGAVSGHEWLDALLTEALSEKSAEESKAEAEAHAETKKVCAGMVESLVEQLLDVQGEDFAAFKRINGTLTKVVDVEAATMKILRTLHMFCDANPSLLVKYVETIIPYIKPNVIQVLKEDRAEMQCIILDILSWVFGVTSNIDKSLVADLNSELEILVYSARPEVMLSAVACMGSVAVNITKEDNALKRMLQRFCVYLDKIEGKSTLAGESSKTVSSAQRAVLACGAISKARIKNSKERAEKCLHHIIVHGNDPKHKGTRVNAMLALGLLFSSAPELMIREDANNMIERCLTTDKASSVRAEALSALCSLLTNEEKRIEQGLAKKELEAKTSRSLRVLGDQDTDSGIFSGLVQRHSKAILSLLFDKSPKVRINAVVLVATMLRQGLINPLQCIEPMVALEADENWIVHQTAHQFLNDLDERHPQFLITRATQGVLRAYEMKLGTLGDPNLISAVVQSGTKGGFAIGPLQPSFSVFSRLYRSTLSSTHNNRMGFLQSAIALFQADATLFSHEGEGGETTDGDHEPENPQHHVHVKGIQLRQLQYVAETLATLPYTLFEEPLYIIYQINRITSLHGDTIVENLKPVFKQKENTISPKKFHEICKTSQQFVLLLKLKDFLKSTYNLSDVRCQKFNPNETTKLVGERNLTTLPSTLPSFPGLEKETLQLFDKDVSEEVELDSLLAAYKHSFKAFRSLLHEDPDDVAHVTSSKKKSRRKSKNPKVIETDPVDSSAPVGEHVVGNTDLEQSGKQPLDTSSTPVSHTAQQEQKLELQKEQERLQQQNAIRLHQERIAHEQMLQQQMHAEHLRQSQMREQQLQLIRFQQEQMRKRQLQEQLQLQHQHQSQFGVQQQQQQFYPQQAWNAQQGQQQLGLPPQQEQQQLFHNSSSTSSAAQLLAAMQQDQSRGGKGPYHQPPY